MALYAFDGTWNSERDTGVYGENTNVVEFTRAYGGDTAVVQKPTESGGESVKDDFYFTGIGTRHGRLGKWLGGAFGIGGRKRIRDAVEAVERRFAGGDETIDVVGFSRGAALALHFTNKLKGKSFRDADGKTREARVRFLGLWDVVAAFGIPIDLGPLHFQRINLGYKLKLGDHVEYCFHAVALDERRGAFKVTRVDNGYQVWFRGVHSDIGGGNENPSFSNISLAWMLRKAAGLGLPIDRRVIDGLQLDAAAAVKPARTGGSSGKFRELSKGDRIHYSVSRRAVQDCQDAPEGCPVETREDEEKRILSVADLKSQR